MNRIVLPAAAAGLLLLVLLVTAPARLIAYFVPANQVYMSGYSGSIWSGAATSAAVNLGNGWLQLGSVEWQLSPWSLLVLSPRIELEGEWGSQRLQMDASVSAFGSMRLRSVDTSFSASLVKQWLPIQLLGDLNVLVNDMQLENREPVSGSGRLVWQRAYWIGNSGGQALGDYVLEYTVTGPMQVAGQISTLSGPVEVSGEVTLNGRSYAVDVLLTSESGFNAEIGSALQLMAAPVGNGYQLKFSSEI